MRLPLLIVLGLLFGGCLEGRAPAPTETPEPTGPVYNANESFTANYSANQCREAFVVVLVEFAQAQRNLPKGFRPKDAQDLFGLPIASGRAAMWLNAVNCAQSEFALGGIDEAGHGVYVQPPTVAGERPAAKYDFYEFGRYTSKEETLRMLTAVNYSVLEGSVNVMISPQAGGAMTGSGDVRNDEGAVVYTLGMTAPATQPLAGRARFWHDTTNGTAYFDYVVNTSPGQGTGSCTIRDLKVRDRLGFDSCRSGDSFGMGFPPYKWESQFNFVAGVHAG